ncbi:hypothetical protein RB213_015232, partial [Colletotrichum asianum]
WCYPTKLDEPQTLWRVLARFDGLELVDAVTWLAHNSVSQPLRQYLGCFSETFSAQIQNGLIERC